MKKIRGRGLSVMLLAFLVIGGMAVYVMRYIDRGGAWAMYFSNANSESSAVVTDRDGEEIAAFRDGEYSFSDDEETRLSLYHVTGDRWDRTGSGVLTDFVAQLQGFDLITGTTKAQHTYADVEYPENVYIMFGKESAGLPEEMLYANPDKCVRIPMRDTLRSLNLSNSVAIAVYEIFRQHAFEGLREDGQLTKFNW